MVQVGFTIGFTKKVHTLQASLVAQMVKKVHTLDWPLPATSRTGKHSFPPLYRQLKGKQPQGETDTLR